MRDEMRVRELLEEVLDANRPPEEVCAGDPDLPREVRARFRDPAVWQDKHKLRKLAGPRKPTLGSSKKGR
jgi:hypothetical protein